MRFNKNCRLEGGTSPRFRTHKKHFDGELFPFGCGVWFLPSPTTGGNAKFEPRARWGIFAGYRTTPGYNWRGDYLVWDLQDLLGTPLRCNTSGLKITRT